ncbi:MAG: fatty acid hydroxylase [Massilia sp.]|jgi:alkylglycerol monooxygenase|nr:fatty acid hydroxylase [Massilia sp.]
MEKIIVFALPVFLVLITAEFAYGWFKQRNTYRLSDTLSSLSQGLLSQLVALVTQLFQIGLYAFVFEAVAIFPHAQIWNRWYGWAIAVVFFDFCDYWLHRMGHECAVMWAAHVVHHQSQHFNFSTALRQESAVAFIGWVFYLPMALLGVPPDQFAIAGLIVLLYQFWIHTEHVGKLGWFDRVFSSPSNHRVHHAVNDQYLDKNYGGMLVIWDRMFGTFAEEKEACVYGTRSPLRSWNPIWAVVAEYWALVRAARGTPAWSDKLRIFFKHPGWRPADPLRRTDAPAFDLRQAAVLYDPPLPRTGIAAILPAIGQFTFLMAATAAYLWYAEQLSYGHSLLLTGAIVAGLWGLGAFLHGQLTAARLLMIDLAGLALVFWMLRA